VEQFLLQMAGRSGVGKTTLASAIGRATGAVVIDHDGIKARMLDVGLEWDMSGRAA
jgi:predicted kinase